MRQDDSCNIKKEILLDFLMEELSYEETIELDNHIRSCGSCRSRIESLTALFGNLRAVSSGELSASTYFQLKSKVFDKEQASQKRKHKEFIFYQKISLVFSAAAVLLITILLSGEGYFAKMPDIESAVYDSWLVDSSLVETQAPESYSDDSLESMFGQAGQIKRVLNPYIKLKNQASGINADQFEDRYYTSAADAAGRLSFPWFLQKSRIISYRNNRNAVITHPARSRLRNYMSCD